MLERKSFNVLGTALAGCFIPCKGFALESDVYGFLKAKLEPPWSCLRIEQKTADGTPDILLIKKHAYCLIEAKLLKQGILNDPVKQLHWQPGQIAFLKRAVRKGWRYMLVVGTNKGIWFIEGDKCNGIFYHTYPTAVF